MILLYVFFLALGIVTFVIAARLGFPARIVLALAAFIVPSLLATLWLSRIGDRAPPDSRTIYPDATIEKPKDDDVAK